MIDAACKLPPKLHPVSELFLDRYLDGAMTTAEFLRFFSLPNSDYIRLAKCIVDWITPLGLT